MVQKMDKNKIVVKSHFRKNKNGNVCFVPEYTKIKAPLEDKSTKLKYQFSIIVPSTEYDKVISDFEFQKRIDETKKFLSSTFGGDTANRSQGDYVSDNKSLITENNIIIETSMTLESFNKNKIKLEKFIEKIRTKWKQESIGFFFEGDFFVYPSNR